MTDRSRLVLALADQRARNLRLEAISPEHLLFALAAEQNGVAAHVLRELGSESNEIQTAFSAGRIATLNRGTNRLPCSDKTKAVIAQSAVEASRLQHSYVGTEHLILALSMIDAELFERTGIKPDDVRSEIYSILGHDLQI